MKKTDSHKNSIFVLFGATGDLALKKIFPALNTLYNEGVLGPRSQIIAVSRRDWGDADLYNFLKGHNVGLSNDFLNLVTYSKIDIEGNHGYTELNKKIETLKKELATKEVYIYLSLAPHNHTLAINSLKKAKILAKNKAKVFIEKPFGTDEKTAKSLDKLLGFLAFNQICRVDHYLGKDTMLALMDLHENTPDFDKLVSKESVSSIHVRLFESKGIDGRGASYDHVGSFRDVGQNHMLEMLAVVCAGLPRGKKNSGVMWQRARAEVFTHLAPPQNTCELSRRGQYEGYCLEKGVREGSVTETAFEVKTHLSSGKLQGTTLVLESGKKMPLSEAFIRIDFKNISGLPKSMRFSIQPEQEIVIINRNGTTDTFSIHKKRDAYANVIHAGITDSSREFVGKEEIEALWRYADRVVSCWEKVPLEMYGDSKPFLVQ